MTALTAAMRPTWAEVDLAVFDANVESIRSILPAGASLVAVLKADGYGHGAVELARRCERRVAMIATALLEESIELRRAGITAPLLVLGPLGVEQIALAIEHRVTMGVPGPEQLELVCAAARTRDLEVHLKLDSGMGRMGLIESDLPLAIERIRAVPRLRIAGVYTHLANAEDERDPLTDAQVAAFDRMVGALRAAGIEAPIHHFANSAATLRRLVRRGDFARVGIALYGPRPIDLGNGAVVKPVLSWRTEIVRLKTLPPGHAVGYGATFHTAQESRIATLPVGYADGYNRLLSNRGEVLVRGRRAPVVGRVSMDLVSVDVTAIPGAALGDVAVLLGSQNDDMITAEEVAVRTGTIPYEVLCGIGARVPRLYRDGGTTRLRSRFQA